ncbi:MAG: type IV secretion system protein VirB10 [Steroidobacteraceae bacterium]
MKRPTSTEPEAASPQEKAADARIAVRAAREGVRGERANPVIARALSVQARASNYLAVGLMLAIGVGLLLWYYAQQLSRQDRVRHNARASTARLAAAEMVLPPLGPIGALRLVPAPQSPPPPARLPSPSSLPAPPLELSRYPTSMTTRGAAASYRGPMAPSAQRSARQRRLSGDVLFTEPADPGASASASLAAPAPADSSVTLSRSPAGPSAVAAGAGDDDRDGLDALLRSSPTPTAAARLLPDRSLLLPKGAFIDCTLETAIDSTLPGMTTCVTATDTFSADGRVVLMERGTKLVGETRGQIQQGAARVFVLWTEARTPGGVEVPLDSPGADQLGRSGLPGKVRRHFWERFGAAILVSTIDGGVQAAVQSSNRGNGTVIYDPGAVQDTMTEVLKSTVAIPPTVIKRNGDRIQVLVARDVDFSSVYELRDVHGTR